MPQHAKTVEAIYAAFGRGDIPGILGALREDVEWEHDAVDHGIPWLAPRQGRAQNVPQGVSDLYAERYQSAKATFEKLLASNPNNIEANYWLGQTYIINNDINGAKAVYDKAATASNNAPLILVGQGHVELLQGKQNEAKQRFESAINASKGKKGNDPNILNAVGRAISESYSEERKTDLDYAISKLTEASQLAASNPDIWLNLGNAYRKKRDGGNAVQAYNKAGNFAPALYKIGYIYESQKSLRQPNDWDIVLENYNMAIVPITINRSHWRGENAKRSEPKRAKS